MSLARHNHSNRISNWFQTLQERKYLKGQKEHGGNLWDKAGMLTHAIEEVIDLAVYLETMEEQLKERFPAAYDFFVSEEKLHRLYERTMPRIYVAGRFRAGNAWEIEQNIRCAENIALAVWRAGGAALCPHTNTRFFQGAVDDAVWLKGDLEWVAVSDALYMVPGWEQSSGAVAEKTFAEQLHIPVFVSFSDLVCFLHSFAVK